MADRKGPSKKALTAARKAALSGDADGALADLGTWAADGSAAAAASAAELHAFRAEWDLVVLRAGQLLREPEAVYAGNVYDELSELVARAGRSGAPWAAVEEVARGALEVAEKQEREHIRERHTGMMQRLARLASSAGEGPGPVPRLDEPRAPDPGAFAAAVAAAPELRPDLVRDPAKMARHVFALAQGYRLDGEIVRIAEESPDVLDFPGACDVARALVRAGDPEAAWGWIERCVPRWWPVDRAQVAPMALRIDPELAPLCTDERALTVLATPRGSEG